MRARGRIAATGAACILLCLTAWLAAARGRVSPFLEELLFPGSENKLLTTIAANEQEVAATHNIAPFSEWTVLVSRAWEWYTQNLPHPTFVRGSVLCCTTAWAIKG